MTTILISTARLFSFRNLLLQVFNLPCDPVEDEIVSNKCDTIQQQTESKAMPSYVQLSTLKVRLE